MQFHALQITAFYSYTKILLFINKVFLTEIHLYIDTFINVNQKHTWDTYHKWQVFLLHLDYLSYLLLYSKKKKRNVKHAGNEKKRWLIDDQFVGTFLMVNSTGGGLCSSEMYRVQAAKRRKKRSK